MGQGIQRGLDRADNSPCLQHSEHAYAIYCTKSSKTPYRPEAQNRMSVTKKRDFDKNYVELLVQACSMIVYGQSELSNSLQVHVPATELISMHF